MQRTVQRRAYGKLLGVLVSGALAAFGIAGPLAGPAAATTGEVMVVGTDLGGGLYYEWQTDGTSTWHQETVSTASGWDTPSMWVQNDGGVLISDVNDLTGTLYYWWQAYGSTSWNQQQVSATGAVAEGPSYIASQAVNSGQPGDVVIVADNNTADGQTPASPTTPRPSAPRPGTPRPFPAATTGRASRT